MDDGVLVTLEEKDVVFTAMKFSLDVEKMSIETELPLLDSLHYFVAEYDIDVSNISKLITETLKEKLALENEIDGFVPTGVLPI